MISLSARLGTVNVIGMAFRHWIAQMVLEYMATTFQTTSEITPLWQRQQTPTQFGLRGLLGILRMWLWGVCRGRWGVI